MAPKKEKPVVEEDEVATDNDRSSKRMRVGGRVVKLEHADADVGSRVAKMEVLPFDKGRVFSPSSCNSLAAVPDFETWWPSEQLQQDTLDGHGIIAEMFSSVEVALNAFALAKLGHSEFWKVSPLKIGKTGGWTADCDKVSAHIALGDPAARKYLSAVNFLSLNQLNTDNQSIPPYRKIVDYGHHRFLRRQEDLLLVISGYVDDMKDLQNEYPGKASIQVRGGLLICWSSVFSLFVLGTANPAAFAWYCERTLRSILCEVHLGTDIGGGPMKDVQSEQDHFKMAKCQPPQQWTRRRFKFVPRTH